MNFNEIVKELSKNYTLMPKASNVVEIVVNKAFNTTSYYFLALKQAELGIVLTDYANTFECVGNLEVIEKSLKNHKDATLCDETIIMPYKNPNSVEEYIKILDEIANS